VAVHHVEVDGLRSGAFQGLEFLGHPREVAIQERGVTSGFANPSSASRRDARAAEIGDL